jgi:hypothetical protein
LLRETQLPDVYLHAAKSEYKRAIELNHEVWSREAQKQLKHLMLNSFA